MTRANWVRPTNTSWVNNRHNNNNNDNSSTNNTSNASPNVQIAKKPPLDLSEPILDPETATDLLFQELGGVELSELLSFGTVSGINQRFNVITNIDALRKEYDASLLVSDYLKGYGGALQESINIYEKIPEDNEFFIRVEQYNPIVDTLTNVLMLDLVITLQNMEDDEELEVEVLANGKIYEVA